MKQIIDIVRGYTSHGNRKRAITMLRKHGFNYFVCFRDVNSEFALMYSTAEWVTVERGPHGVYVDW